MISDQELRDRAALHDLVMTYCRATDRRDYGLLRSLYHDDAIEDRGAMFKGGPDEWIAWAKPVQARFEMTVHRIFNTLFVVDGDRAEGEHYAEAYHRTFGPDAQEVAAGGRFIDRYEKREGVWKFTYRSATSDLAEIRPVDPVAYQQLVTHSYAARIDGDDQSYKALGLFPPRRG